MKNSWQMQVGPPLLRAETNLNKYQKKLAWPFIWSGLCFSQGKDVLNFGLFWVFWRKRLISQSFSPKISINEAKKCRTRTGHFTCKFLQKNDKKTVISALKKKTGKISRASGANWLSLLVLVALIMIQLPQVEKNWQEVKAKGSNKIIKEIKETVYLSLPKEINFSQQDLIEVEETVIVARNASEEASLSGKLTQTDKVNLALASFYKGDWANYQAWLNDAKEMDPNEFFFK